MLIRDRLRLRLSVFVVLGIASVASALGAPTDLVAFGVGVAVGLQLGIDRALPPL